MVVNSVKLLVQRPTKMGNNNFILIENLWANLSQLTMCSANASTATCWPSLLNLCHYNSTPIRLHRIDLFATNTSCFNYPVFILNGSVHVSNGSLCIGLQQNCTYPPVPEDSLHSNSSMMRWSLGFWIFLITTIINHVMYSVLLSLTDAVTFVSLGKDNAHKFGFSRMFGTFGILLFSILTGLILQGIDVLYKTGQWKLITFSMSISQFTPCFIIGLLLFMFVIPLAFLLKKDKPIHTENLWK